MSDYGIPYMGSKAKIIASIAMNFPAAENFYDLFGGGFAVTHYMIERRSKKYRHFHYNEINGDVVALVKRAIAGEFNYKVFKPAWVSSQDFHRLKDSNAYVRCLWSFGNNQKDYLFGDIEPYKKSMHQAIIFDEFDGLAGKTLGFDSWPHTIKSIYDKRIFLRQKIERYRKTKIPEHLHKFLDAQQLQQLQQLERLQQLQQLERLQQLQQLERLHLYTSDYREVPIKKNSVVYCDIPYKGTAEYLGTFNHQEFYNWAASCDQPVFISEYGLDDPRFKLIYSVDKRSLLSFDSRSVKSENLYWNGR